jgi:pimeloyl-ACP methyl ester carboxylesterase
MMFLQSHLSFGLASRLLFLGCSLLLLGGTMQTSQTLESSSVEITTPTGTLYGTQIIPKSDQPEPVVLIIAGSGPTDRNGNSTVLPGQNNSLKLLAEGLAERGIASVRYDKRGIAQSFMAGQKESNLLFDMFVDDAALWVRELQADPRFSSVTVIGHSEGSLIGMLAVQQSEANAFVSIAGPARSASTLLREQLRPQLPEPLWQESERILMALEQEKMVDSVPPELNILYRPSVQPYLISWFRYTPAEEIQRLSVSVLIVQGTTDIQVPVSEAEALKTALPAAELKIIEGMNHVFKAVPVDPEKQTASYSDPSLPVVPELIDSISQFVYKSETQE